MWLDVGGVIGIESPASANPTQGGSGRQALIGPSGSVAVLEWREPVRQRVAVWRTCSGLTEAGSG